MLGFLSGLFSGKKLAQAQGSGSFDANLYSTTDTTKFYPPFSQDSLDGVYFETAKYLWEHFVPKSGQSETVQGELIRASERLDYEIRGNGKINWNEQFVILGKYLRDTLVMSNIFPGDVAREIEQDIQSLIGSKTEVVTDDAVYARISRRIVEWYWRHKEPIKHRYNPKLKI